MSLLINKTTTYFRNNFIITLSTFVLLVGCANANKNQQEDIISDANIAAIVVGANNIDISAGKIALELSENTLVKNFAERMITDHKAVLASAVALVTKLGVTPVNNELVATLAKQSSDHEENLRSLSGNAFDKSYIDHEVAYHKAVIAVIENQLIPAAQNDELKALLISVIPAFNAHLAHCQMIQNQI